MIRRFDWTLAGKQRGADPICDVDLLEHPCAAVVPTLGSLVPGWLLAIPRQEVLSYSRLDAAERHNLLGLARRLSADVECFGEKVFILEHGPATHLSRIGCGVDQAHLHIVPLRFNLLGAALADLTVDWLEVSNDDPWSVLVGIGEYYLISERNRSYIGFPKESQSQYFRRHIAREMGLSEMWDYREWPFYENAQRTAEYFDRYRVGWRAA